MSQPDDVQIEELKELAQDPTVRMLGSNAIKACSPKKRKTYFNDPTVEPIDQDEYTSEGTIVLDMLMGIEAKNRAKALQKILSIGKKYKNL